MVTTRYCLVLPYFHKANILPAQTTLWFIVLIISVVLISAAGYLINDYFDVKADEINKPNKIMIGRLIKRRQVMFVQIAMNIIGLLLGYACAKVVNRPHLVLYHIVAICLLWYYSTHFKKQLIIGNVTIAFLTGLVCLIVVAFEWYKLTVGSFGRVNSTQLIQLGFIYASFAFLVNLCREIIKDAEDRQGDMAIQSNSIPLKYGFKTTRNIVIILLAITLILIVTFAYIHLQLNFYNLFVVLTIVSFAYLIFKVYHADTKADYHHLSNALKIVMLFGILSMLLL